MNLKRIIPVLLLKNDELYKTTQFGASRYIGDPINAVKIFNEKEVDELIILDIEATIKQKEPNYNLLEEIASESFVPLAYGGGVKDIEVFKKLVQIGFERICINSATLNEEFVKACVQKFGSSSVIASIDYKLINHEPYVYTHSGRKKCNILLDEKAIQMEKWGVGELIVNNINLDGSYKGYDLDRIILLKEKLNIPVIICGGASSINDLKKALSNDISAAAGSLFVYYGNLKAVLINYPSRDKLKFSDDRY